MGVSAGLYAYAGNLPGGSCAHGSLSVFAVQRVVSSSSVTATMSVVIIGEDHKRLQPLLEELDRRRVPTTVWNTSRGALVPGVQPPARTIFFCRQSPSAASRGHASAMTYATAIVQWLEHYGSPVINGTRALAVESSKALQMQILAAAGLNTPHTVMCQGLLQLGVEVNKWPMPLIVKPNMGGSGKGVESYANGRSAAAAFKYASITQRAAAPDGLWVAQPLLGVFSTDPTVMRSILRIEVVGGRVQRDYLIQITAPATDFTLCPCDPRTEHVAASMQFKLLRDPLQIPGFRGPGGAEAFDAFCVKIEAAFAAAGSSVGAVEGMVLADGHPDQAAAYPHPHEPVLFDFNVCNTNYNQTAEEAAGIYKGVARVADMLQVAVDGLPM